MNQNTIYDGCVAVYTVACPSTIFRPVALFALTRETSIGIDTLLTIGAVVH